MDDNKAIEVLKNNVPKTCKMVGGRCQGGFDDWESDMGQAIETAVSALKKQIPQKPVKVNDAEIRYTDSYRCPACGSGFTGTGIADYCYHCGQALNWDILMFADNDTAQPGLMPAI